MLDKKRISALVFFSSGGFINLGGPPVFKLHFFWGAVVVD